jgi:hypothetical protein
MQRVLGLVRLLPASLLHVRKTRVLQRPQNQLVLGHLRKLVAMLGASLWGHHMKAVSALALALRAPLLQLAVLQQYLPHWQHTRHGVFQGDVAVFLALLLHTLRQSVSCRHEALHNQSRGLNCYRHLTRAAWWMLHHEETAALCVTGCALGCQKPLYTSPGTDEIQDLYCRHLSDRFQSKATTVMRCSNADCCISSLNPPGSVPSCLTLLPVQQHY